MSTAKEIIRKIQCHENLKYWVMYELTQAGIECEEQQFHEQRGDILIVRAEDVPLAMVLLQELKDASQREHQ